MVTKQSLGSISIHHTYLQNKDKGRMQHPIVKIIPQIITEDKTNGNEQIFSFAYSFLASLVENQNDLYTHVYLPICKRALSYYNAKIGRHGKWSDIRDIILNEYGINAPQIIVKQLISSVHKSLSYNQRRKAGFEVFSKGDSFHIEKYAFGNLEEKYRKGMREANALQEAFVVYLKNENKFSDEVLPLHEFFDKNKKLVASFFSNTEYHNHVNKSFFFHFEFLKYIESKNHELYKIAENQYIGSLVAGYFEAGLSLDPKFSSKEIYYIDTAVALRALNLQKEDETESIMELFNLITSTGGTIKILSITVKELKNVIENAITYYDKVVPTTTINEACLRLGKNKAWLMSVASKLDSKIQNELGVQVELLSSSFIEKHRIHKDVKKLQETRMRKGNALHDVLSYLYVRQLRGDSIFTFQKAKIWFLTTNESLLRFNKQQLIGDIPEIVTADSLTSLLWLKNPTKLVDSIKKTGLNTLLATTFNEEIVSKELINEFNNTIQTIDDIPESDYRELLESAANQSARNIDAIIEVAKKDKDRARIEMYNLVENERAKKHKNSQELKDSLATIEKQENNNMEMNKKLSEIEGDLLEMKENSRKREEQIVKTNKKYKLIIISLILVIVLFAVIILNAKFSFLPSIFNWIMSAGGLFAFGNFIINLINLSHKTKQGVP